MTTKDTVTPTNPTKHRWTVKELMNCACPGDCDDDDCGILRQAADDAAFREAHEAHSLDGLRRILQEAVDKLNNDKDARIAALEAEVERLNRIIAEMTPYVVNEKLRRGEFNLVPVGKADGKEDGNE